MNDEQEGYTDFENDEKETTKKPILVKDKKTSKEEITNKEDDDLESLYTKEDKVEEKDEDDDLESLYNKKEDKEEMKHTIYSTDFVNNLDSKSDNLYEYVNLFSRYQKENKNLLNKTDISNKSGEIVSLEASVKEETDYEKFMAKLNLHNSIKIPLFNSAFTINLKECTIGDIVSIIGNIQDEIGVRFDRSRFIYYFFLDHLLLKEIKNLLSSCIVGSNLEEQPQDIFDVISLHDMDVIITYLIDLIFKDGYEGFELSCAQDECGHKETINIKPKNLIYTNFDKLGGLPKKYFAKILKETNKTKPDVVDRIRDVIYKDLRYKYTFDDKDFLIKSFEIEMQDVFVNDFLNMAEEYMNQLYEQIEDQDNLREVDIRYSLVRHIIPHIKVLTITKRKITTNEKDEEIEEDGDKLSMTTFNEKMDFLNSAINHSKDRDKVLDFLNDKIFMTKFTHILLPNSKCTKCQRPIFKDKAEDTPYIPIVPFLFFFITSIEFFNMTRSTI